MIEKLKSFPRPSHFEQEHEDKINEIIETTNKNTEQIERITEAIRELVDLVNVLDPGSAIRSKVANILSGK